MTRPRALLLAVMSAALLLVPSNAALASTEDPEFCVTLDYPHWRTICVGF